MTYISHSEKLQTQEEQYIIFADKFVFFRIIKQGDDFKVMTATASENSQPLCAYEKLDLLISTTISIFGGAKRSYQSKRDRNNIRYVEFLGFREVTEIEVLAKKVIEKLGFDPVNVAMMEMKELYDNFAIDDSGEDVYLSDGMWLSADGKLTEK